jgi:hypothetical protein
MSDITHRNHRLTQCPAVPEGYRLLGVADASVLLGVVPIILDTATVGAAFHIDIFD